MRRVPLFQSMAIFLLVANNLYPVVPASGRERIANRPPGALERPLPEGQSPPNADDKALPPQSYKLRGRSETKLSDGRTQICSAEQESYSFDRWQWATFQLCVTDSNSNDVAVTLRLNRIMYFWGLAWYTNKNRDVICDCLITDSIANRERNKTFNQTMRGTSVAFPVIMTSNLNGNHEYRTPNRPVNSSSNSVIRGMYWHNYPASNIPVPRMMTGLFKGLDYTTSRILRDNFLSGQGNRIYYFGPTHPIPIQEGGFTYSAGMDGVLISIPNATSGSQGERPYPYVLGDNHQGPSSRCEMLGTQTQVDSVPQEAELYTPSIAWGRLGTPDFAINTNYFDTRQQTAGSWQDTNCSVPLGIYYDNNSGGPTAGTHNGYMGSKFLAGPPFYIMSNGLRVPLDTYFWQFSSNGASPSASNLSIILGNNTTASAALNEAQRLDASNTSFVAFSGTSLIPQHIGSSAGPDEENKDTSRIGIGYRGTDDRIFIIRAGPYRMGIDRRQLAGIFRSLNVTQAFEIDGGGSAAVVIREGVGTWGGASPQPTSCPNTGAWCSPITQPDGRSRPVPGWLGIHLKPIGR